MTRLADMSLLNEEDNLVYGGQCAFNEKIDLMVQLPLCEECWERITDTGMTLTLSPDEHEVSDFDLMI